MLWFSPRLVILSKGKNSKFYLITVYNVFYGSKNMYLSKYTVIESLKNCKNF